MQLFQLWKCGAAALEIEDNMDGIDGAAEGGARETADAWDGPVRGEDAAPDVVPGGSGRDSFAEGCAAFEHPPAAGDAAALERGHAELARDIPGWSPELADELGRFATREFGFTEAELATVIDPRLVKLLHRAHANAAGEARLARIRAAQGTAPAPSLSRGLGRSEVSADTEDFAAFEKMADARLRAR